MMKRLPIFLFLTALVFASQSGCDTDKPLTESSVLTLTPDGKTKDVDLRNFASDLELMSEISSVAMALTQADEAASKQAVSNEVRLLAAAMVMDHKKSYDKLLSILDRKNMAVNVHSVPSINNKVRVLNSAGTSFDSTYLAIVIWEHEDYLTNLRDMRDKIKDQDFGQWADQSILLNESHTAQARKQVELESERKLASN